MKSSWIVGWALKLMASVVRDRQRDTDTEGREGDVKPEAEIRGSKPRAGAPGDARVGRSREGLSGRDQRGPWPCQCLEFRFMVSGTVGEKNTFLFFQARPLVVIIYSSPEPTTRFLRDRIWTEKAGQTLASSPLFVNLQNNKRFL